MVRMLLGVYVGLWDLGSDMRGGSKVGYGVGKFVEVMRHRQ